MVRAVPAVTRTADHLECRAAIGIVRWVQGNAILGFQILDMLVMSAAAFDADGAAVVLIFDKAPGAAVGVVIMAAVAGRYGFYYPVHMQGFVDDSAGAVDYHPVTA